MMPPAREPVPFVLILKGIVGVSVVAMTLLGVAAPHLGIEVTDLTGGMAAGLGAVLGGILAARA